MYLPDWIETSDSACIRVSSWVENDIELCVEIAKVYEILGYNIYVVPISVMGKGDYIACFMEIIK